jgi:SAM-dependent methyltransferase
MRKLRQLWSKTPNTPVAVEKPAVDNTAAIAGPAKPVFAPKPVDAAFRAEMARHINYLCDNIHLFRQQLERDRAAMEWWDCMPPESYQDKDVLDLGCGTGAGSAVFLERGARLVWGVDPELNSEVMGHLSVLPRARFIAAELSSDLFGDQRFDLIYAQFVTEHIRHMPGVLDIVFSLLKPGGRFIALHDNYYSPMGGHDHAFLGPVPNDPHRIHVKSVPCWDSPLKCEASKDFREQSERTYGTLMNLTLTPEDCAKCHYYQRSHIWAHLLFQDVYPDIYQNDFFISSRCGGVNKITPFQLRQFLIEAGFEVTTWRPNRIANEPPAALANRFAIEDLQTATILFAAEKPLACPNHLPQHVAA